MKGTVHKWFRAVAFAISLLAVLFVALSFTSLPYWAYFGLASVEDKLDQKPTHIVVMGGDGMPSPSGLMRTYYGIKQAVEHPDAKIILALPYNEDDSTWQLSLMAHEFVIKGIDSSRIIFEPKGFNTQSQAAAIANLISNKTDPVLIVTSPEHTYRCLATFRKVGFSNVGGSPTFEMPSDEEMLKDKTEDEKKRVRNLSLRYNMWSYMQYEIIVMREYCAITYYWLNGWI